MPVVFYHSVIHGLGFFFCEIAYVHVTNLMLVTAHQFLTGCIQITLKKYIRYVKQSLIFRFANVIMIARDHVMQNTLNYSRCAINVQSRIQYKT